MAKKINWVALDPQIKQWHAEGKSPYFMSKELGLSRDTIARHMERDLELSVKKIGVRTPIQWVSDTEIKCKGCGEVKPEDQFYSTSSNPYQTHNGKCKACMLLQSRATRASKEASWAKKNYDVKQSAKKRGIEYNLPEDYLETLYSLQGGLCAYTDMPIRFIVGAGHINDGLSVDRFDTSKGYVVGNIVLTTRRANSIKLDQSLDEFRLWMPVWYEKGLAVLQQNIKGYTS